MMTLPGALLRFYPLHRAELVLWGGPDRRAEFQGGIRVAENDARLVL